MYEETVDIDKKILYWIEQFGFKWINYGELIDHIKENYIKNGNDVVRDFVEIMEWKVDINYLDKKRICEDNEYYEYLCEDLYLYVYGLENDEIELMRLDLIE